MSAEWVTAIATVFTALVIAASAFAAVLQIRHIRSSNQIAVFVEVRERIESADFEAAANIRKVANFFESLGAFVKRGVIDADLACDVWGAVVLRKWNALEPVIGSRRAAINNNRLLKNFEYLASLSKDWIERHPEGTYPAGVSRMPRSSVWREAAQ